MDNNGSGGISCGDGRVGSPGDSRTDIHCIIDGFIAKASIVSEASTEGISDRVISSKI